MMRSVRTPTVSMTRSVRMNLTCTHRQQETSRRIGPSSLFTSLTHRLPLSPSSSSPPHQCTRRRTSVLIPHAAAAAAPKTAISFWPILVQAYSTDPVGVLLSIAASIAAIAFSVLILSAVPTILAMRRSVLAAEALIHVMRAELPDTAAAVRLSSLEMSDAVQEVSALGNDLTEGVRASARALVSAEQGVRQGITFASSAVTDYAVPSLKRVVPETKGMVEGVLKERSVLNTTQGLRETAGATKVVVQRLRAALGVVAVGGAAGRVLKRGATRNSAKQLNPYATE